LSLDEIRDALAEVRDAVHSEHPDAPRLGDLDAHLATVEMTVEHIYDEAARAAGGN